MGSLGIAIDDGRYVRVESSLNEIPRTIRLRTMRPGQDTAKLDFYVFRKNGPRVCKSVLLLGLSGKIDAPSELRLSIERRFFSLWRVNILKPDGTREIVRVRTGIGLIPLVMTAAGLIAVGLWLLLPRISVITEHSRTLNTDAIESESTALAEQIIDEQSTQSETAQPKITQSETTRTDKTLQVTTQPPGTTVIYFQPESAVISNAARDDLQKLSELLSENISLEIGGHCASFGTERGRWALSKARADAVAGYLSGIISQTVNIEVKAYGGSKPLSRNPELQYRNRRVEITLVGGDE